MFLSIDDDERGSQQKNSAVSMHTIFCNLCEDVYIQDDPEKMHKVYSAQFATVHHRVIQFSAKCSERNWFTWQRPVYEYGN